MPCIKQSKQGGTHIKSKKNLIADNIEFFYLKAKKRWTNEPT